MPRWGDEARLVRLTATKIASDELERSIESSDAWKFHPETGEPLCAHEVELIRSAGRAIVKQLEQRLRNGQWPVVVLQSSTAEDTKR